MFYDWNMTVNELWTDVIEENNIALRAIKSKSFVEFANFITNRWKRPSRRDLSNHYIPKLADRSRKLFLASLSSGKISYLSIEFDHWKDRNGRSLMGVIATTIIGQPYVLDLIDHTCHIY